MQKQWLMIFNIFVFIISITRQLINKEKIIVLKACMTIDLTMVVLKTDNSSIIRNIMINENMKEEDGDITIENLLSIGKVNRIVFPYNNISHSERQCPTIRDQYYRQKSNNINWKNSENNDKE